MRLDHLLSRERTEEESEVHSRSIHSESCVAAERLKEKKNPRKSGRMTVLLLEPVSFSGIGKRKLEET